MFIHWLQLILGIAAICNTFFWNYQIVVNRYYPFGSRMNIKNTLMIIGLGLNFFGGIVFLFSSQVR